MNGSIARTGPLVVPGAAGAPRAASGKDDPGRYEATLRPRRRLRNGGNLQLIAEQVHPQHLAGFDLSDEAVLRAREKNPGADVYRSDLTRPELRQRLYELVLCCDVLYATGLDPARDGLACSRDSSSARRALLLHVPAYQWLYSAAHDAAVHTRERFTLGQIRDLLASLELQIETLTYRLALPLPPSSFSVGSRTCSASGQSPATRRSPISPSRRDR